MIQRLDSYCYAIRFLINFGFNECQREELFGTVCLIKMAHRFISRLIISVGPCRRYKSSDVTGVAFSPIPDAELKIQLYYKSQEIKRRKEKLKEIAQTIWNAKPNVNYTRITLDECKTMFEEQTGRQATSWETKQIYK